MSRFYLITLITAFVFLMPGMVYSQVEIQRDTSYNLESAFRKYIREYPKIEPVYEIKSDSIERYLVLLRKRPTLRS